MDIFENLENLNVSEECFDEIMGIVEELLSEAEDNYEAAQDRRDRNKWKVYDKTSCVFYDCKGGKRGAQKEAKRLNTNIPAKPHIDLSYESLYSKIENLAKAINEKVTVERVRKAAENSIPTRQAKFEKEAGDPEALPVNPNAYKKAADKLYAAKKMANLPKGDNRDYAKLRKAARKVRMDRDEQAEDAWAYSTKHNPEIDRLDARSDKADSFAVDSKGKMQ